MSYMAFLGQNARVVQRDRGTHQRNRPDGTDMEFVENENHLTSGLVKLTHLLPMCNVTYVVRYTRENIFPANMNSCPDAAGKAVGSYKLLHWNSQLTAVLLWGKIRQERKYV